MFLSFPSRVIRLLRLFVSVSVLSKKITVLEMEMDRKIHGTVDDEEYSGIQPSIHQPSPTLHRPILSYSLPKHEVY